jgi:AraC-like DNA-binding protein
MFSERLKSWLKKFQKFKVTFKDGFFHLSNLANSPFTMVQTFDNTPFINHYKEKKLMTSNTLFINVEMYYAELEEGLWILLSDMEIKRSFVMHNIFDETMPVNYNFINLHYNRKSLTSKSMLIDGMLLTDKTWTLFKPGTVKLDYHFKDAHEYNITVYFTDEWFAKEFKSITYFKGSNVEKFFKSDNRYIFLTDTQLNSDDFYGDFLALQKLNGNYSNNEKIKALVCSLFKQFIEKYELETINEDHFKLNDKDRRYIKKTEKYLLDHLLKSFPGIEAISKTVGVSATKLKNDFKMIHNQSLYNYYRYHQMHLARKLLSGKASTVKEVANLLGYENASKFAAVFKDQFGVQPSSLIKEKISEI